MYAIGGGLASAAPPNLVIAAVPVHLQAVSANTVGVIGTLGSTAAMQVGFAILLGHIVTVVQGSPIYGETGVVTVYLLAAGLAILGLVATLAMRHGLDVGRGRGLKLAP